jgi:fumarate reductase subunit D
MIWLAILLPVIVLVFALVVLWGVMQIDNIELDDFNWNDED